MKFSSFFFFFVVYLPFIPEVFDKNEGLGEWIDEWGRESRLKMRDRRYKMKIEGKYLKIEKINKN